MRRTLIATIAATALLVGSGVVATPLGAASAPGAWPQWTITPEDPEAPDHSGTIAFGLPGMPDATYTVSKPADDGEDTELETNDEEYIGAGTPFGQVFGASGPSTDTQFLKTRLDTNLADNATVVVTFAAPVPAGVLGFAVSDVDVDQVVVSGTQPGGAALSGGELAGEAFNLCNTPDVPEACDGATAPFPVPTWDPATRTVLGSGDETEGEAAWFRPTVAVESLTFVFTGQDVIAGAPSFRLWLAALQATVDGTVTSTCSASSQPATLNLIGPDGSVVQSVTAGADGTYAFDPALAVDGYQVEATAPEGCVVEGTNPAPANLSAGNVTVNFTLVDAAKPVTPKYTG